MASEAAKHEAAQTDASSMEVIYCALNAVLSSVAFLEAQANELLQDAAEGHHSNGTKNLSQQDRELLAGLWPLLERASVLDKFQEILKFLRKSQVDRSAAVWGNAQALIKLRNYLVHYKPESAVISSTIEDRPVETLSIERQLANKFPKNPWFENSVSSYIASHMSSGCARWASSSALQFADEFYRILGVDPPYEHLRNKDPKGK